MVRLVFPRRQDIEEWLEERGFGWEALAGVAPDRFDQEKSLHNQARLSSPLVQDQVDTYRTCLKNGDRFPPIVAAWSGAKGKSLLVTVDGNHRMMAHALENRPIAVYAIKGDESAIIALTLEANTKHGLPVTPDDRVHGALYLVGAGMSLKDAAVRMGLNASQLNKASALHRAEQRATEADILPHVWASMHPGVRARLASVSTDEGFKAAAKLAIDARLATGQLIPLVSTMNTIRSSQGQVDFIKAQREEIYAEKIQSGTLASKAGQGRKRTPRQAVAMFLGATKALPDPATFALDVLPAERDAWAGRLSDAINVLEGLRDGLADGG